MSGRQGQGSDFQRSLRDTYNPEPQWLRQDRENRDWSRDDADEYGQDRARHAGSERAHEYQRRDYQGRDHQAGGRDTQSEQGAQSRLAGRQEYGSGFETSGWDDDLDLSESQGRYEPFRVGTGMGLGTGRQFGSSYGPSFGYGGHGPGYGTSGDEYASRQWQAGSHRGAPQYGGRSGYDLGTHQRDIGREPQRSYRGLGPQNYKRPDERIRDDIHERLTDDHRIDARGILVDVNQGNVTLTGTVIERRMRYAAEDLVEAVMGVANIDNQLRVQQEGESTGSGTGASPGPSSTETKRH